MKKVSFLLLFTWTVVLAKAQNGKPTKEQTISYIKSYFVNAGYGPITWDKEYTDGRKNPTRISEILQPEIQFTEDNKMVFIWCESFFYHYRSMFEGEWLEDKYTSYEKTKVVIDLNKIEAVSEYAIQRGNMPKYSKTEVYLKFKTAPGSFSDEFPSKEMNISGCDQSKLPQSAEKKQEVLIPVALIALPKGESYIDYVKEYDKIKKAFDHLRKLCGAPEPISFD